jgi:hypothetical protein
MLPNTPATNPIDIPNSASSDQQESSSLDDHISPQSYFWRDESVNGAFSSTKETPLVQKTNSALLSPATTASSPKALNSFFDAGHLLNTSPILVDVFSKMDVSYTESGINLEAKISNASDLRSLIDTFSQMCRSSEDYHVTQETPKKSTEKMILYRNKSNQTKPVNFFASTNRLGKITNPHSSVDTKICLRRLADACVETFFTCWVRFKPILKKDEFMAWYESHGSPTDTLIVNSICSYVFRHMVIHHPQEEFAHFTEDFDKLQEQEEYFFSCARECLSQSFDSPDRYTIAALLFMSTRCEPTKRHHYSGMAISALHQLNIYPRMSDENVDSYDKEMDTRLWWFAWAIDFSLRTAGSPKNTPQPRLPGKADLPQVFEQDIDEDEISVLTFIECLKLWKIQSEVIATLYDESNPDLTAERLKDYDNQLLEYYKSLPKYLCFESGFEYGCQDLFIACLRVNIEYNATRIILHKLFIPEMNDPRPSQASLESLNICLSTALIQLRAIKTCNMADIGRCAFDRDELWRAAEVISVAMEIYHTCIVPEDRAKILHGISLDDFDGALEKAFEILKNTREYRSSCKNWFQVADWMQVEIRRHQLVSSYSVKTSQQQNTQNTIKRDYFLATLKPNIIMRSDPFNKKKQSLPAPEATVNTSSTQPPAVKQQQRKPISFQNQFSFASTPSNHISTSPTFSVEQRKPSFSAAPPFVQFNSYEPPDQQQHANGKSQARFRYFNPRKMNKFLFIDEHPMF